MVDEVGGAHIGFSCYIQFLLSPTEISGESHHLKELAMKEEQLQRVAQLSSEVAGGVRVRGHTTWIRRGYDVDTTWMVEEILHQLVDDGHPDK